MSKSFGRLGLKASAVVTADPTKQGGFRSVNTEDHTYKAEDTYVDVDVVVDRLQELTVTSTLSHLQISLGNHVVLGTHSRRPQERDAIFFRNRDIGSKRLTASCRCQRPVGQRSIQQYEQQQARQRRGCS